MSASDTRRHGHNSGPAAACSIGRQLTGPVGPLPIIQSSTVWFHFKFLFSFVLLFPKFMFMMIVFGLNSNTTTPTTSNRANYEIRSFSFERFVVSRCFQGSGLRSLRPTLRSGARYQAPEQYDSRWLPRAHHRQVRQQSEHQHQGVPSGLGGCLHIAAASLRRPHPPPGQPVQVLASITVATVQVRV